MATVTNRGTEAQAEQAFTIASGIQSQMFAAMDAGQSIEEIPTTLKDEEADCWWAWHVLRHGRIPEGFGSYYPATEDDVTLALHIIERNA